METKLGKTKGFLDYYKTLLIIAIPACLLLPLPILVEGKESRAGYLLLLMACYWCTEVIPLGITALLPLIFVPLFGISPAKDVTGNYMEDTTVMLMGGLIVALAVEKCNLHRRIAIRVLLTIGGSPKWLVLGFMVPTWFLSMWISNTASAAMMMPIVEEILASLEAMYEASEIEMETIDNEATIENKETSVVFSIDGTDNLMLSLEPGGKTKKLDTSANLTSETKEQPAKKTKRKDNTVAHLGRALTISVAYAANVGGTSTLIGTMVNPVLKGQADEMWARQGCGESPINFASWIVMGMPLSIINLFVIWLWLEVFFIGIRELCGRPTDLQKEEEAVVKQILLKEYQKLGKMSVAEIQTSIIFVLLVLLWFFRDPGFIPGWDTFFDGYTSDATPVMLISVLLFIIPGSYRKDSEKNAESLLTWKWMKERFCWDVVLLLGGGFALADATKNSGLSDWIGDQMTVLEVLPGPALIIVLGILVTIVTQFTSNVPSASLLLPIAGSMAEQLERNPLYLMFPVAIAVQYAFMLPVATPPNAVAFITGRISVLDMVKAGSVLNVACVLTMTIGMFTWGNAYFDFDTLPWSQCANQTIASF